MGGVLPLDVPLTAACPTCEGTGGFVFDCDRCGGEGTIERRLPVPVRIPAGVPEGTASRSRRRSPVLSILLPSTSRCGGGSPVMLCCWPRGGALWPLPFGGCARVWAPSADDPDWRGAEGGARRPSCVGSPAPSRREAPRSRGGWARCCSCLSSTQRGWPPPPDSPRVSRGIRSSVSATIALSPSARAPRPARAFWRARTCARPSVPCAAGRGRPVFVACGRRGVGEIPTEPGGDPRRFYFPRPGCRPLALRTSPPRARLARGSGRWPERSISTRSFRAASGPSRGERALKRGSLRPNAGLYESGPMAESSRVMQGPGLLHVASAADAQHLAAELWAAPSRPAGLSAFASPPTRRC